MLLKATALLLAVMCSWYVEESVCFPNGKVEGACDSMTPQHGLFTSSTSSPPYTVSASSDTYRPGQVITVTVEVVNNSTVFEGFLLQARSRQGSDLMRPLGMFSNINTDMFTALNCRNMENSAVSQASTAKKKKVDLTWMAPNDTNCGDIYFSATVVRNLSVFWVQLNSSTLRMDSSGNSADGAFSCSALLFISLLSLCVYY